MAPPELRRLGPQWSDLVSTTLASLAASRVVERLWAKDFRLWKPHPEEISNRLGWLTLPDDMRAHLAALTRLASETAAHRITDVVLLGMGGSSLGPEVLRQTFGRQKGQPRLWVLDSTVPGWVRTVTHAITPARTLFLVASKSGGTIEVLSLFAHFWHLVARTPGNRGGAQFLVITDPGTGLEQLAHDHRFAHIVHNPPDIGGRYSVLSLFGLVPAALLGLDVRRLLQRAARMAKQCRVSTPPKQNPGLFLGAVLGALAQAGRNKVTLVTSPPLKAFGLWAEQLLAESTGKEETGLIPVAQEPLLAPSAYGTDRFFIYLRLAGAKNATLDRRLQALARAGHPVLTLPLRDCYDLGAEFFRWELATAVAGHLLGIHPFDQPNVQESKDNTQRVLKDLTQRGQLPDQPTWTPRQAATELGSHLQPGTYLSILAYTAPTAPFEAAVQRLRRTLVQQYRITTTFGYGPRYLHSTGQLHKGGPKGGVFLELIDRMTPDLAIPGAPYSFGALAQAQAAGDVSSLHAHGRVVLRLPLGPSPARTVQQLHQAVSPLRRRTRIP